MSNCTNVIKTCMSQGLNLLSVGYHGVGKTQMVLDEAKSQGLKMKYYIASSIRLALEERWAPPNRKIAWLYPDVLLPADHEVERYQNYVLMAIDASGSISRSVLDRFLGVARSIPADRVQLTTISFDTKVYPVDIRENVPAIRGGGGTSFKAVEMFATEQMSRYPDLIVVLTDGYAPRPAVQHLDRWFWLVTENGTIIHVEGIGRCCRIDRSSSVSVNRIASYKEKKDEYYKRM